MGQEWRIPCRIQFTVALIQSKMLFLTMMTSLALSLYVQTAELILIRISGGKAVARFLKHVMNACILKHIT